MLNKECLLNVQIINNNEDFILCARLQFATLQFVTFSEI